MFDLTLQFLMSIMPSLHAHVFNNHRPTLLSRYFGLHFISFQVKSPWFALWLLHPSHRLLQGSHIRIVVMENLAWLQRGHISSRFDMKGSWYFNPCQLSFLVICNYLLELTFVRVSRQVLKDESPATFRKLKVGCKGHDGTLKDLDMTFFVRSDPVSLVSPPHAPALQISFPRAKQARQLLIRDLQRDVTFLESANIMDYSLFIAFEYVAFSLPPPPPPSPFLPPPPTISNTAVGIMKSRPPTALKMPF
jgi:hypothetical protein